jgi:lysophospholipase L1-like esterase
MIRKWQVHPFAIAAVIFIVLDAFVGIAARYTTFLQDVVDIQTPATLYAKLDYLRTFHGRRIAFLGDSVVYGRRMEETGDARWRDHTIPAHTQSLLQASYPNETILGMNLAMNGALPADIEQVVRMVLPLKPDCIVADVSLRSFSTDFAPENSRFSRPWLGDMRIGTSFNLHTKKLSAGSNDRLEAVLRDFALSHWRLYRIRDFVQWRVFNGEPSMAVGLFRNWLDQKLSGKAIQAPDPLDDILLMLKAKNRHDSITLTPDNPQVAALKSTLEQIATSRQCALFFYATEDKGQLSELIDSQRYQDLQVQLAAIFAGYKDRGITYIPPLDSIKSEYYLDYGHLNDAGNMIVAKAIVDQGLRQSIGRVVQAQ